MTEADAAEVWIKQQLALADAAVEMHPITARDLTLEQYERQLRQGVKVHLLPTEPYLGLEYELAQALAVQEGRQLVARVGRFRRTNFVWNRVNIAVDSEGRVVEAKRDRSPWSQQLGGER